MAELPAGTSPGELPTLAERLAQADAAAARARPGEPSAPGLGVHTSGESARTPADPGPHRQPLGRTGQEESLEEDRPAARAQASRQASGWQLYLVVGYIASGVFWLLVWSLGLAIGLLLEERPSDEVVGLSIWAFLFVSVLPAMWWARLSGWRAGLLAVVAAFGVVLVERLLDQVTGLGYGWVMPGVIGWLVVARVQGWRPSPRPDGG